MDSGTSRSIYNAFRNMASGFRSPTEMELDVNGLTAYDEPSGDVDDDDGVDRRQYYVDAYGTPTLDEYSYGRHNPPVEEDGDDDNEDDMKAGEKDHDEVLYENGLVEMESNGLVDISNLASWEVSSSKVGFDVVKLREDSPGCYWQSDGAQPHFLLVKFARSVNIKCIGLFLNYAVDESYTPENIVVMAGTGEHDLIEVVQTQFVEPVGWQYIRFDESCPDSLLNCFMLKIKFISNHQNGKDCHIRGIKILSPLVKLLDSNNVLTDDCVGFTSLKLIRESSIR